MVVAGAVGGQDLLYAVEGLLVDQSRVTAAPLDAASGDDAEVVVIAQDAMHLTAWDWTAWSGAGGSGA